MSGIRRCSGAASQSSSVAGAHVDHRLTSQRSVGIIITTARLDVGVVELVFAARWRSTASSATTWRPTGRDSVKAQRVSL